MKHLCFVILVILFGCVFASDNLSVGIPSFSGQVVEREGYALGYSEEHEQAAWVQYHFTAEENSHRKVSRTEDFREDPEITSGYCRRCGPQGKGGS